MYHKNRIALKSILRKVLRIILWIAGLIPVVAFCIFLMLKIPAVQGFIRESAVNYLKKKLDTEVQLGRLHIDFPTSVELDSLFIADRQNDTLLYTHRLFVETDMLRALFGNITIDKLQIDQLVANVHRTLPDTTFNFSFIINAFSSDTSVHDTSKSSTRFAIHGIDLKQFRIRYNDAVTGYDGSLSFKIFKTHFNTFNPDSMRFRLDSLVLSGVNGYLVQSKPLIKSIPSKEQTQSKSIMPDISFKNICLDTILLNYKNKESGISGTVDLDTFQLASNQIKLRKHLIDLKEVFLNNTHIALSRFQGTETGTSTPKIEPEGADTSSTGWIFKVSKLMLVNNNLTYNNNLKPSTPKGIDYNHLDVTGLNINLADGYYSPDSSHATIHDITLKEKSGFDLKRLTTDAVYTSHRASLSDLDLQTTHTHITHKLAITYAAIDSIGADPGDLGILADLSDCKIDLNDVLYFHPALDSAPSMKKLMHSIIKINGKISGKLKDIHIEDLALQAARHTDISLSAHITGLPEMKKSIFNITLKNFSTTKRDINRLLPPDIVSASFNIPDRLSLKGTYTGSLNTFTTRLLFRSTDGDIDLRGKVNNLNDSLHAAYDALVQTNNLNLGRLLKNDTLYGNITTQIAVKGSGLTKNSADAELKGIIQQAEIKGYDYHQVVFSGNYRQRKGELTIKSQDPNVRFNLVSSANLSGEYPGIKLNLNLDSVNLYALHFSRNILKFRGKLRADFPTADIDHLNGKLILSDVQMVKDSARIDFDSIALYSISNDTIDSLHLNTPFARADISGHYQLSKAGILIKSLMQHYFGNDGATHRITDSAGNQDIRFQLAILNHPLWQMLIPSLQSFSGGSFKGELSSHPQSIRLNGRIPKITLGKMTVDSLQLAIHSDTGNLRYLLSVNRINNGTLEMYKTTLEGNAARNKLTLDLKVRDDKEKNKYRLAGALSLHHDSYKFSFNPDSILLNYEKWQMEKDNYIIYNKKGILANDIKLERNGQYLSINSPQKAAGTPLEISFHHFGLGTLTRIASSDTTLVSGTLDGKVIAEDLLTSPVFTANLHIDSLALRNQPVGNIALKVNNKVANAYAVDLALTGDSNNLKITGIYRTKPQSNFDFNIAIPALNIASVQAFTFGQVKDGSGLLTGNLYVKGTAKRPQIEGALTFKKAALTITKVNDHIKMPDETIKFDNNGIHFNHFTLIDSLNNKAFVDGDIFTNNFRRYRFALNITAKDFRVLNAKQNQDEKYYGPVFINANIKIRGDQNLPIVNMNLKVNKKSSLTVVLPGSNPATEPSEGIVEFVTAAHINDTIKLGTSPTSAHHYNPLKGIQLSANISVDTAAVFNIIIDPVNGDILRVKGDATLNMTMDPGGKISLTGRYEISEGSYSMSLERIIKRTFNIKKGSTIIWTGDPTSATLDLTAIYNVKASAMELVEDQLTNLNESAKNTYKQQLPFEVLMNIKGQLMKPDISFSLDMPETSRNAFNGSVYTRINQINTNVSEVNKQALGLLVFGHFIADNPFQTSGGGGAEQMARQSASKILSQQLNNLAGNLIKGVDLNFDVQSSQDYSTGKAENKTNLNVGVSKSLFNNRTTVYVGSNIQLEGPQQTEQKSSQIAGDVAIEYKLSRDGRYRLRAYRKNKYEGVIEGEFIETGLSFIIVMDYNHFKELFQKRSRRNSKKK